MILLGKISLTHTSLPPCPTQVHSTLHLQLTLGSAKPLVIWGFPGMGYPKMDGWSGGTPILGNVHIILVKQSQLSKNHIEAQNLRKMDILLNIWPQKVHVSFWAFPLSNKEHFCNQCPSLQRQPAGEELSDVNYGSASFPRCFFGVPFATFQIFQGNPSRFYQPQ